MIRVSEIKGQAIKQGNKKLPFVIETSDSNIFKQDFTNSLCSIIWTGDVDSLRAEELKGITDIEIYTKDIPEDFATLPSCVKCVMEITTLNFKIFKSVIDLAKTGRFVFVNKSEIPLLSLPFINEVSNIYDFQDFDEETMVWTAIKTRTEKLEVKKERSVSEKTRVTPKPRVSIFQGFTASAQAEVDTF
jgi:hypothetical protein